jgi:predicted dehydrogenase
MTEQRIGVGLLGHRFMGRAHSDALLRLRHMVGPPPLRCDLVAIAGRDEQAVREAAERYGFERAVTDWRELIADPQIGLLDNVGPNALHAEPTIAAAEAGKHVICEKPLARSADEAYEVWRRVAATGVKHLCAFNYRFVPAVRLAREMIEAGELGEIHHFRGTYLQEWLLDPAAPAAWRLDREQAGSGALGDLGSHLIDLARYLTGEISSVTGAVRTFIGARDGRAVDVDDAFAATLEFEGGAIGTLEASRFAAGRKNALRWELNGSQGSLAFDLERLNELQVSKGTAGFRTVIVTEPEHPFLEHWWPPGHALGWEHTFVHELHHLVTAISTDGDVGPHGATFEDGYRAAEVCDAIQRAAADGTRHTIRYREPGGRPAATRV